MKLSFIFLLVFILSLIWLSASKAQGQSTLDTILIGSSKFEDVPQTPTSFDSSQLRVNEQLSSEDSLRRDFNYYLTERTNQQLDSIQNAFNQRTDSLMSTFKHNIGRLDSLRSSFRKEFGSLTNINLPGNRVAEKLDSVTKLQTNITSQVESKLQEIKDQASSKITQLNLSPELAEKARAVTGNINVVTIPTSNLKIRHLDAFDNPLGKLNDFGKVGELNGLNSQGIANEFGNVDIPQGLGDASQLTNATGKFPDASNVSSKLKGFSSEAGSLPKGDVSDVENLSKVAEEKAAEISGISEIEKQTESLDQYKEMATKPPDQDSLKEMAIVQIRQVAVNHFAGKEQVLQEAMETMTKYKNRYSSVTSISDLPKKRPNEMRGKPFIERIIPGVAMQIQKTGGDLMVDFNAYAAFRFTPKMNAGIGWNQRVAYNTNYNGLNSELRVFGPRIFGEYNLWKGFSPRAELEVMNTNVPAITTTDPLKREWVWGAFIGVKKEYRIIRNIKGTAMVMTRLFNPDHKSPYADVLNVRFGFEFPIKKKIKI